MQLKSRMDGNENLDESKITFGERFSEGGPFRFRHLARCAARPLLRKKYGLQKADLGTVG